MTSGWVFEGMVRDATTIKEHRLDTGRIALNLREIGTGPLVLFLHGITAVGAVWDPIILKVGKALRAVAVDQRGHGLSDKPASGYAASDYSKDVIALIEALGGGPAIVVGHSLGARNALIAGTLRPELIAGVVAVDFTPFIESEVFDSLEARVLGGDRVFQSRQEIEEYLSNRYPMLPRDAVGRRVTHGYYQIEDNKFRPLASPAAMAETAKGLREDLEPAVLKIDRPVVMIRGAESKLVSEAAFTRTLELRSFHSSLVVENTDHYVPEEAADVIADTVLRFAAELRP